MKISMAKSKKAIAPKKKRGGVRTGAGRKPAEELKKPVTIYVKESSIEKHGGEVALKETLSKVAEGESYPALDTGPATQGQKNRERKRILKAANPLLTEEFKSTFAPETDKILDQIAAIRAENIPKDRDTVMGRKSWELDQRKRIEELQNQLG